MKKGILVALENTGANTIMGRVVSYQEDGGEVVLKEVGETESDTLSLLNPGQRHEFKLYPKSLHVTINLWHIARSFEWKGRLPKGWRSAVAALEEAKCNCSPVEDEEDEDEDNEDDDE